MLTPQAQSVLSSLCFLKYSLAFSIVLPFRAALEKEFGEQLVANGCVGEAMTVFERRELWDSLLICYQLLEKVPEALSLAEARLKVAHSCSSLRLLSSPFFLELDPSQPYKITLITSKGCSGITSYAACTSQVKASHVDHAAYQNKQRL